MSVESPGLPAPTAGSEAAGETAGRWSSRAGVRWTMATLAGVALLWPFLVSAPETMDYWWLLGAGRYLREHGLSTLTGPHPFVFTAPSGSEFFNQEWLFSLVTAWVWQLLGHGGNTILRSLLVLLLIVLFFRLCRRLGARPGLSLLVFAVGATSVLPTRLSPRPHLVGFVLLLGLLLLLTRPLTRTRLLAVVLLFVLWANIHGSFAVGFALVGWAAVVWLVRHRPVRQSGSPVVDQAVAGRRWLLLVLGCLLAVCVNPYGWELWLRVCSFGREVGLYDPVVMGEWAPFTPTGPYGLFQMLLLGLVALSWLLPANRRHPERLGWAVLAALPGFQSERFTADTFLVLGPLLAAHLRALGSRPVRLATQVGLAGIALVTTAMMVAGAPRPRLSPDFGSLPEPVLAPLDRALGLAGNIFVTSEPSGYLIFKYRGRLKVSYDAHVIEPGFLPWSREFKSALLGPSEFDRYCARYRCDLVLFDLRAPSSFALARHLLRHPRWRPLRFTLGWALYARDGYLPAELAAERFVHLRPFYSFGFLSARPEDSAAVLSEVSRLGGQEHGAGTAAALRGFLALRSAGLLDPLAPAWGTQGPVSSGRADVASAVDQLLVALGEAPWHPGVRCYLGLGLAALGRGEIAVGHLRAAAATLPIWTTPRVALVRLLWAAGRRQEALGLLGALGQQSAEGHAAAIKLWQLLAK